MSARSLGFVVCRLFAVYLFVLSFGPFATAFHSYIQNIRHRFADSSEYSFITDYPETIEGLLYITFAILFWFSAKRMSKHLSEKPEPKTQINSIKVVDLQSIVISSIGVYLIARSVPRLVAAIFDVSSLGFINHDFTLSSGYYVEFLFAQTIMELIFGILFIFFAGRMSRLLLKFRTFGLKKNNNTNH